MANLTPIRNALLSADAREENSNKHTRYEKGQMLIHAKSLCAHGEWLPFLEEVGISTSLAHELMSWANHWQMSTTAEVSTLKPSSELGSEDQISATAEVSPERAEAAMPTAHAQREFLRADPKVQREIVEKIIKDPEAEIKAAEIKELRAQLSESKKERDDLVRRVNAAETNNLREVVLDCGIISSAAGLLADLSAGMVDEYYDSRLQPAQQQRLLQTLGDIVSYAQAFIDRKSAIRISPQIIDV